jgi:hypothetical protein
MDGSRYNFLQSIESQTKISTRRPDEHPGSVLRSGMYKELKKANSLQRKCHDQRPSDRCSARLTRCSRLAPRTRAHLHKHVPRAKSQDRRPLNQCSACLTRCTRWLDALACSDRALGFRERGSERAHDGREVKRLRAHVPRANTTTAQADPSSVRRRLPRT